MSDAFSNLFHNNNAVQGERFIAKKPGAEYPMMYSGKPPLTWGQYEPGVMADTPEAVAEDKRKHDFYGSPADQAFIQQMQQQPEGSQITDPAWIGASKNLYHYMNPTSQAQTEELAKYNLTPISSESFTDEDYANWGVNFMSKFNYNITAMLFDVNKLSGAPSQVAASMYYLMETADRDGLLLENFVRGFSNFMTDPTTYVGLSTLGIGMVGTQSGKQLSKMAFKDVLKNIVMNRGGSAAAVAGVEGAAFSAVGDAATQSVAMNAGQQEEFAGGQNALSMAAGAVLGNRLAAGLPAVGETVMRTAKAIPDVVDGIVAKIDPPTDASYAEGKIAGNGKLSSKAQDAASKLSRKFGVDFNVSNHPTSYGNSTYVSGRIAGPEGTFVDVGFRLSDHSTGDKRKATDDFLTIIDDGEVTSETLVAEVQGQLDRALPKMQKMSDDREAKAIAQSDALSRWSELSGDERGEIAVKFKEIRPGYANGKPWKNLTKQQKADFAARENLLKGGQKDDET